MEPILATLVYLVLGLGLRRLRSVPDATGSVLNSFVIHVSLPALVLLKIHELTFSSQLLVPVLMPWVMLILSAGIVLLLSRVLRWDRATTGCLLLLIPLGNTSFLGIPMVTAFFGPQAVPYAVLYDQLGSFLAVATYGVLILSIYSASGTRPTPASLAKRVLTFPPFVALMIALALKGWAYPPALSGVLTKLAATLVPVVMIAVGFQLSVRLSRADLSTLSVGLLLKLVAAPLAALLLCKLLRLEGEPVDVSIFEAGMAPMITAGALALSEDLAPRLSSALVGFGMVASFATLPLLYRLIR